MISYTLVKLYAVKPIQFPVSLFQIHNIFQVTVALMQPLIGQSNTRMTRTQIRCHWYDTLDINMCNSIYLYLLVLIISLCVVVCVMDQKDTHKIRSQHFLDWLNIATSLQYQSYFICSMTSQNLVFSGIRIVVIKSWEQIRLLSMQLFQL